MNARQLFDSGRLADAIAELNQEVKAHPSDIQSRTFLFELLCFSGDYARARRQLDVLGGDSVTAEAGVQVYRNVLAAEEARRKLYTDGLRPEFVFTPPPYAQQHLEAVNRLREKRADEARALLDEADETRPAMNGSIDGQPFADFRDGDDLLAPFLEAILYDKYVWLPFEEITRIEISPPTHLRDLLWIPATIECRQRPLGGVFLLVLYGGSNEHEDERVKLGRMTDWMDAGDGVARGAGQRLFLADDDERAVLETRVVEFNHGVS